MNASELLKRYALQRSAFGGSASLSRFLRRTYLTGAILTGTIMMAR